MAKDDHWFKFYYRLIILSCQGWKDDEFGAYVKLLIHQFDKGGLPESEVELGKLITTFKKNWPLLSLKFKKGDDGLLRNDFMKVIRDERDEKARRGAEFGKTGGRGNKKGKPIENKGNPLENERESVSLSFSPSLSGDEEGGLEGEEEVGLSPHGFFSDTLDKALPLTDMEIGASIEYLRIKSKKVFNQREIVEHWEAFKIKQFSLHDWYNSWEKLLNHFRDSLKLETNNGTGNSRNISEKNEDLGTSGKRIRTAKNW
jgi:hypothetical protein